jgi:hypothetical protein
MRLSVIYDYLLIFGSHFAFCSVCSAAVDALTAFVRCFISPIAVNSGILIQPVLVYLSRYVCQYFEYLMPQVLLFLY